MDIIKFNAMDISMKKYSTSFWDKTKFRSQKTKPTIPAIAALLTIIVLLVGTTTSAILPAVLATTETVSIENRTDTEVTVQDDEALADGETQRSTGGEVGQESTSSSIGNQSEPTTLPSANNTNSTAGATTGNATNTIDLTLDGRIVFAKSISGDQPDTAEIYVMNADGSGGQTRLTDNTVADFDPTWSPDGEKIAFASGSGDIDPEIYVMNADGSDVTQLTNNNGYDASPSWSPDGERIAFVSDRAFQDPVGLNRNFEIYVMNVDDGNPPPSPRPRQIIEEAISTIQNLDDIPQGLRTTTIVLLRQILDIIDDDTTDGTVTPPQEPTRLTNNNASDASPSWSPDGERIAFSSDRDGNYEIYVMNADDGSEQTRLTEESEFDGSPSWSPDGERIAFDSNRGNQRGIFVMNADDGSGVTRLSDGTGPAWSPDSEKIAFTSARDADDESDYNAIYVMNSTGADSSNATRLTEPDSYYEDLDWSGGESIPGGGSNATNNTGGGGGNATEPLTVQAMIDIDQDATPVVVFEASIDGGRPPYTCDWDLGDGTTSDACSVSHIYENPGTYAAIVTVTDSVGQTASDTTEPFTISNTGGGGGNNTMTVEELPVDVPPTTDDTGGEATAPANDTGEQ
jgi:Tol biopolymer transport system component